MPASVMIYNSYSYSGVGAAVSESAALVLVGLAVELVSRLLGWGGDGYGGDYKREEDVWRFQAIRIGINEGRGCLAWKKWKWKNNPAQNNSRTGEAGLRLGVNGWSGRDSTASLGEASRLCIPHHLYPVSESRSIWALPAGWSWIMPRIYCGNIQYRCKRKWAG